MKLTKETPLAKGIAIIALTSFSIGIAMCMLALPLILLVKFCYWLF